jgi:O-antigen/teichoic acid export membrane protein
MATTADVAGGADPRPAADLDAQGRPPGHNAALAALADIVGKVSTLAWTVVAARALTQDEFGTFSLALSLAALVSSVAEGGFDPVLVRKASNDPARLSTYHSQAIAWQSAIALPLFMLAAGVVWAARSDADMRVAIVLVLAAVFLDMWSDTARASAAAARDQAITSRALGLQRLAAAALMIPALVAGLGVPGMAAGFLAASVAGWVAHVAAVGRLGIAFHLRLLDRAGMRAFARGTVMLGVSSVLQMALLRVDAVLLAVLAGDQAVGEYAAAYRLFETVLFLTYAVVGSVAPLMYARAADRAEVARLAELMLVVLGVVYAPFAAVCLIEGRAVLELLFGSSFAGATPALQWLAAAPLVYAASGVAAPILIAVGRTRGMLVATTVALVVNIVLNLLLIPSLASTAAALATTVAYAVEAAIGLGVAARLVPRLRVLAPFAETLVAAAAMALVLEALPLPLLVELPLGVGVYAALWWALVRTRQPERLEAVASLLRRGPVPA